MTEDSPQFDEIRGILTALIDGQASDRQLARLEELLASSRDATDFYRQYMRICALLEFEHSQRDNLPMAEVETSPSPISIQPGVPLGVSVLPSSLGAFLGDSAYGTANYLCQGWPLAYLIATVIFGIGLLIGSHIYVSQPAQVAQQSAPLPSHLSPLPSKVGRITGMVDCQFVEGSGFRVQGSGAGGENSELPSPAGRGAGGEGDSDDLHPSSFIPHPSSPVSLGDKFALASGLMEITYDTGARVILQGPVTYEMEANGGYLSVGKLTGKLKKKNDEARMTKDEGKHEIQMTGGEGLQNSSFVIRPSSFVIHTPTAIVTDLGTEFGVKVDRNGLTHTHVFAGKVRLISANLSNHVEPRVLVAGEAANCDGKTLRVALGNTEANAFARDLPKVKGASSLWVSAHFRMGEEDPGAAAGQPVRDVTSDRARRETLRRSGSPRYTAEVAAPGSTLAVEFNRDHRQCYFADDVISLRTDGYGIEAWVRPNNNATTGAIVWNGDFGWGLLQRGDVLCGHVNPLGDVGAYKFTPGQWYHMAMVRDDGKTTFYVNGQPAGSEFHVDGKPVPSDNREPAVPHGRFWIGCTNERFFFDGAIDEVRVFRPKPGRFRPSDLLMKSEE